MLIMYIWIIKSQIKNVCIDKASASDIEKWLNQGHFSEGSMAPKIRAALYFLKHHGEKVVITSLSNIEDAINNKSGTVIK